MQKNYEMFSLVLINLFFIKTFIFSYLPVKGLAMWCQVCSHAGHLKCLKEWFKTNKVCPSGCSHKCWKIKDKKNIGIDIYNNI